MESTVMVGPGVGLGEMMMFTWVLVIVGIVVLVVWLRSQAGRPGSGGARHGDSAQAILRERFAKGEISREEFDQMRRELE